MLTMHCHCTDHQKPGKSEHSRTFVFGNEDHTLGNALRHVAMQRCGVA